MAGQPSTRHRTGLPGGGCRASVGSIHAELSRNASVHFQSTEANVPPRNGRAAAGAATSHSPKPLGLRFGKKKKISQICHLGKQLLTTTGPALLKNQDVGSVGSGSGGQRPVPGPWAQARGTCSPKSAHVHVDFVLARGQAHTSAPLLTRGRTSGTPHLQEPGSCNGVTPREFTTERRSSHLPHGWPWGRVPCWDPGVGGPSVICWKPHFSQKPAEQTRFSRRPPGA